MKIKRALNGRFSTRRYYKLPYQEKIKPVLMWYYASLGVLVSCYLISGAFYECFLEIKTKLYETKRIVIINQVGAGADDRADVISGEDESVEPEVSETLSVEETIKKVAEEMGFEEADNLVRLAMCESSLNPESINPTNNSYDRGVFQISRKYHPEIDDSCAFDVSCATEKSIEIIQKDGGPSQWSCQKVW